MKFLPLVLPLTLLVALAGCRSSDGDASLEVATAEMPSIRYYMIADT